jgi:hypothetical protein
MHLAISDHITFPLKFDGIKFIGCPIGTGAYCNTHIQKAIATVRTDLDLLTHFPLLHQRIKLAIYCCNTRITYLLLTVPLATALPTCHNTTRCSTTSWPLPLHSRTNTHKHQATGEGSH